MGGEMLELYRLSKEEKKQLKQILMNLDLKILNGVIKESDFWVIADFLNNSPNYTEKPAFFDEYFYDTARVW